VAGVLISAVLLASASAAWASSTTYYTTSYEATPTTDYTVLLQITTSGPGPYVPGEGNCSASFVITEGTATYAVQNAEYGGSGELIVNGANLVLASSPTFVEEAGFGGLTSSGQWISLDWLNSFGLQVLPDSEFDGGESAEGLMPLSGDLFLVDALPDSAFDGSNLIIATAVPEPSTFALLGAGVLGLLGYVWRRKRR
jgi:hypothetical protein